MNEKLKFCKLLGTNINVITMDETVDYMDQHLDELRGKYVCVSNVHTTVMAFRDADYRKVQNGSAMNLPDGKPPVYCMSDARTSGGRTCSGTGSDAENFRAFREKRISALFLWQYGKNAVCAGTEAA